ncbi:hypothetical protein [Chroococcidiopsis sp. TS-821]|uniref:hypothetical protein n=1 Tax=Chroococcidiopsis sp. TS-821 TaxID=1378066 RepID=UPI000CEE800E|nr:hypothetical protein [Chroococcidiopsis sp. TS-821]PPS39169.1 hypothetical protein B1A85_22510 [Chroococcidiopsis sp. TS-821]
MRQQILEQANNFDNEIQAKYAQIVALIEKEVQEVRNEKMDRVTLANLLTQMAMQLNNEFDVLGND